MAHINLLPWREKQRKAMQFEFLVMLGLAVLVTGITMGSVHFYHVDRTTYQEKRIAYIENSIRQLDKQIAQIKRIEKTRENLRKRIEKVRDLERNRAEIVHLFDEISKRLPAGVYLTAVQQKNKAITIRGVSNDNNDISTYITNLASSEWLEGLDLDVVKHIGKGAKGARRKKRVGEFVVTAVQKSPKDEHQKLEVGRR